MTTEERARLDALTAFAEIFKDQRCWNRVDSARFSLEDPTKSEFTRGRDCGFCTPCRARSALRGVVARESTVFEGMTRM